MERTFHNAKALDNKFIYVATDDERIEKFVNKKTLTQYLPPETVLLGQIESAEVAKTLDFDIFLNVQGDGIFNPDDITTLINGYLKHPETIICGYTEIKKDEQYLSQSNSKVIFDKNNNLLYII